MPGCRPAPPTGCSPSSSSTGSSSAGPTGRSRSGPAGGAGPDGRGGAARAAGRAGARGDGDAVATVGETVILTAPCGLEGIVLHVVETERHSVRLSYALFRRAPMHRGASGKVLAAYLEPAERERLLEAVGRPGLEARAGPDPPRRVRVHGRRARRGRGRGWPRRSSTAAGGSRPGCRSPGRRADRGRRAERLTAGGARGRRDDRARASRAERRARPRGTCQSHRRAIRSDGPRC